MKQIVGNQTIKQRNIYFVILAGGSGTRLWPLSNNQCPKQLLSVVRGQTLLEQTIKLVHAYKKSPAQVWISTSSNHLAIIEKNVGSMVDHIIVEPWAWNTGPAILFSCLRIYEKDPEALILFLPADSYIPSSEIPNFVSSLERLFDFTGSHENIALFGVKPTHPATGYGYIEFQPNLFDSATGLYGVEKFHEKPHLDIAQEYIKQSKMLWNIGMFGGQVSFFLREFKFYTPELYQSVFDVIYHNASIDRVPFISIDYALIERSANLSVLPVDFSWCDVGNLDTFLTLKQRVEGLPENVLIHNAHNNLVDVPSKVVALLGVSNLCIVETNEALLIMHTDQAENVRLIVNQIKNQGKENLL